MWGGSGEPPQLPFRIVSARSLLQPDDPWTAELFDEAYGKIVADLPVTTRFVHFIGVLSGQGRRAKLFKTFLNGNVAK